MTDIPAPQALYPDEDGVLQPHPTGLVIQTNDEYHAGPGISKSHLDAINAGSPRHYWHKYLNPAREAEERTEAMIMGSAVHSAILEPDLFPSEFMAAPDEAPPRPSIRQVNAKKPSPATVNAINFWKDFDAENVGRTVLRLNDFNICMSIRDAVHTHPVAAGLLTGGKAEQSFYAIDSETGELIKCRTDYLHDSGAMIVDVKTTEDASPNGFGKSSANFRYPVQTAWYNGVLDSCYGEHPENWVFLAVEKSPPFAIGLYFVEADLLERAQIAAQRDFMRIVTHRRSGEWPDYGMEPQPLILPGWGKL